ncbi:hypothetical protein K458DRAFT_5552 [Lentithecium fluviatile CBS 122367]|uniref:Uncharacterized protein n=1 Tax=Lentithecium fluviatile CBS 122367 TaxID=1168545 RepID=A0A6G1JNQ8_9PLEO|nr:hypothetical protein K458DRAFT_5552 [Lentithecium fluviatile CBS 122367]
MQWINRLLYCAAASTDNLTPILSAKQNGPASDSTGHVRQTFDTLISDSSTGNRSPLHCQTLTSKPANASTTENHSLVLQDRKSARSRQSTSYRGISAQYASGASSTGKRNYREAYYPRLVFRWPPVAGHAHLYTTPQYVCSFARTSILVSPRGRLVSPPSKLLCRLAPATSLGSPNRCLTPKWYSNALHTRPRPLYSPALKDKRKSPRQASRRVWARMNSELSHGIQIRR